MLDSSSKELNVIFSYLLPQNSLSNVYQNKLSEKRSNKRPTVQVLVLSLAL